MMRDERVVKWLNDAKPYLGVVFLQVSSAGSAIISKAALNQGMNPYTFSVYRNAIAAVIFAPFAIFLERYFFFPLALLQVHQSFLASSHFALLPKLKLQYVQNTSNSDTYI